MIAAGRRDDPDQFVNGIVGIYEAATGRTLREVFVHDVRWAALAADGRMFVAATSHGSYGDTHFIGIEVATGRIRWTNPSADERAGFAPVASMRFEASSPWFETALRDGNVIRFNSLTGHEQRRFLADWRTPEQKKTKRPRRPDMARATFSADARTLVSSQMGSLHVCDVFAGALRRTIRDPDQHIFLVALAPDGNTLAATDLRSPGNLDAETVRLFDIGTSEQVLALPCRSRVLVMVFSSDGKRLVTGLSDGSSIVWDVQRPHRGAAKE